MTFVSCAAEGSHRVRWLTRIGVVLLIVVGLLPAWPRSVRAAEPGGRLSGVVRDAGGNPQANVRVLLVDTFGATVASDTAGSGGRYSLAVSPGRYDLGVLTTSPVERAARIRSVDVGADTTLDVVVLPPEITLSGTLRDSAGAPYGRNIKVYVGWRWDETDDNGHYSITVPAGTWPLSVSMSGAGWSEYFSVGVDSVDLATDRTLDLTVAFTTLTVQVVDQRGDPLPNAVVSSHSAGDCESGCEAGFDLFPGAKRTTATSQGYARTDSNGLATITTLAVDQRVQVESVPPEYRPVTSKRVEWPWSGTVRLVQRDGPTPPPPPVPGEPVPTVTWTGVLRHNGDPVQGGVGGWETESDGWFELRLPAGHHSLDVYAEIGFSDDCDSGGCSSATYVHVPDFEMTADRTMDIDIPTATFAVHVVDQEGQPAWADVTGTSGGDDGAPIEIFPGGAGRGWLRDHAGSPAGEATLLIFPGSPPPVVTVSQDDALRGSATVAPGATSVTVAFSAVIVSGTVRDARGPLPLVNWPWVSFSGSYGRYQDFDGDDIHADGSYSVQVMPGQRTLTITDEPQFDENDTDQHVPTATMPQVWTITLDLDLTRSKRLDLTIPDAGAVRFRTVDTDGQPMRAEFNMESRHTLEVAPGLTAEARAATHTVDPSGQFEHMVFPHVTEASGWINLPTGEWDASSWGFTMANVKPGDSSVFALATNYTGGPIVPVAPPTTTTTLPAPTTTTLARLGDPEPGTVAATGGAPRASGYWTLSSDGHVNHFGDAAPLGSGSAGAVDLEPTPTGKGYWALKKNGGVQPFGDAPGVGDVDVATLTKGELPASLSATPSGKGYWVFTNRGRAIAFGDAPHLGDVSGVKLNGPVLGSVATPTGKGYYMVASDGGIFAFGDAKFEGSMGGTKLNAPVQSLVPDSDGKGYWLVASDGGIFAFDAPFRGSLGGVKLNKPVVGMVRYGDGYLMVGADGGIFNFSSLPFSGSLGDKPPASPVVAVAALP